MTAPAPPRSPRRFTPVVFGAAMVFVGAAASSAAATAPDDTAPPPEPVVDETGSLLSGPTVAIERSELAAGEEIIVTIAGFDSRFVNVAVCGNQARRGSGDCDMQSAKGREVDEEQLTTRLRFRIANPPTPCPCIIRVASNGQSEVAVVPITLADHPVAEPVDPVDPGPLVEATISATPADGNPFGRLRTALGGPATYDVTVTARNTVTTPLHDLVAAVSVGQGEDDDLVAIELEPIPGSLAPGQQWRQSVQVELPALRWGEARWRLVVSGAGPTVEADQTTSRSATALYVLVVVLVLDIVYILYRIRRRKRNLQQGDEPKSGPVIDIDDDGTVWTLDSRSAPPSDRHPDRADEREPIGT